MHNAQTTPTAPVPATPATPGDAANKRRNKSRGQSVAELALTLPFALLMVLFGLDFGRVFLGWVALNNAAREAANYAAMNPTAWTIPYNLTVQAEYARLVQTEASSINCTLVDPVPAPTFSSGTSIGAPAAVKLTCAFHLITPFIGMITGNPIPVSASSAFPVRSGYIEGVPVETFLPTASPAPSATGAPTATPGPTATAGASVSPTASTAPDPTPTPAPTATPDTCVVPSLLGFATNQAAAKWKNPGFTGPVIFSPLVPPNFTIAWQSLTVGTSQLCTSSITVRRTAP